MNTTISRSPVLVPPKDPELRRRLEAKLAVYKTRKEGKGKEWKFYKDACYKVDVLSAVLSATDEKPVNTLELSIQLGELYGREFEAETFNNACTIIATYLGQTAVELYGGTGLPD